jgi:hypothetical protein
MTVKVKTGFTHESPTNKTVEQCKLEGALYYPQKTRKDSIGKFH